MQTLVARIEENPLSDWNGLLKDIVRSALDCRGEFSLHWYSAVVLTPFTAFTSDQMSTLSDALEATLPQATSSPPQSPRSRGSASSSRASVRSRRGVPSPASVSTDALGTLAKEFGVDPLVVEALAQRLSSIH